MSTESGRRGCPPGLGRVIGYSLNDESCQLHCVHGGRLGCPLALGWAM